jgi:hypothetical protein
MASTPDPYPVVEERSLDPAVRGWLGRSRSRSDLPRHRPGTVPVFEVRDGFVAFHERRYLGRREDLVVNAVSVSTVDLRPRTVTVQLQVPSNNPADEFVLLVDFHCEVRDPEAVAAAGLSDMVGPLRRYLRRNASLIQLGVQHTVEEINLVRDELSSRVDAYTRLRAPQVGGMTISLAGVRVITPKDLVVHKRDLRDTEWRLEKEEIEHAGEDRNAERLRNYVDDGPDALAALAAARGEFDLNGAVDRGYRAIEQRRQQAIEFLKSMPEEEWHTIAMDSHRIVAALTDELFGTKKDRSPAALNDGGGRDQLES